MCLTPLTLAFSQMAIGHGVMVDPPSRNAKCGINEKPDNATSADCVAAFETDRDGGYRFMSVLTHDLGRAAVTPLPDNVCGFDSETWQGGETPWDTPTNWSTTDVQAGPIDITWDVSWGPHFSDTEEFRYWITKPDFTVNPNRALTWDDFESDAFCVLEYDDTRQDLSPNIVAMESDALFTTSCNLPARSGHHVVYGEWGRNQWTYERFHGCIDMNFQSGGQPAGPVVETIRPVANSQSVSTNENENVSIALMASDADGYILSYEITSQPVYGTLSGNGANYVYSPTPGYSGPDRFRFTATDNDGLTSSAANVSIDIAAAPVVPVEPTTPHVPTAPVEPTTPDVPAAPVEPTTPDVPAEPTTPDVPAVTPPAVPPMASTQVMCDYVVQTSWPQGFVANIRLNNIGTAPVEGWDVQWSFSGSTQVQQIWGATLSGSNPYSASNLSWNETIEPGQQIEFGLVGRIAIGETPSAPVISGSICTNMDQARN